MVFNTKGSKDGVIVRKSHDTWVVIETVGNATASKHFKTVFDLCLYLAEKYGEMDGLREELEDADI